MRIAETDEFLIKKIKDKDLEAILSWFDERKASFYKLGWTYVADDFEMENVFHDTIMEVFDTVRQLKDEKSFTIWVTTIFLKECRDRANKGTIENTLFPLDNSYKEPMILTYLLKFSQEETAEILGISIEDVTSKIHEGIKRLASVTEYCNEYSSYFIDYLNRTIDRAKKIEFEIHFHTCLSCQKTLAVYQEVILNIKEEGDKLEIPASFFQQVTQKVNETKANRVRVKKKQITKILSASSIVVFILLIGYFTNTYTNVYYTWVDWQNNEDPLLRSFYKSGLGERLNLEAESNGVKVTIKSVIADEYQTLVYYEVENLQDENQYMISMFEGIQIANEYEIVDHAGSMFLSFPSRLHSEQNNIFKGTVSLQPIRENGVLELKLSRLQKVEEDDQLEVPFWYNDYNQIEFLDGDWSFEIPVTKHSSIVHEVGEETDVEGVPVTISKLIIAPTTTILEYEYDTYRENENIHSVNIGKIMAGDKELLLDMYGFRMEQEYIGNRITTRVGLQSMYFDDSKEIEVHFDSMNVFLADQKIYNIDFSGEFPQTFDYKGHEISIDELQIGSPTVMTISNDYVDNRAYERIEFHFITSEEDQEQFSMGMHNGGEGVYVDRDGNVYEADSFLEVMDELKERPRYFQTKSIVDLINYETNEEVIPNKLVIEGYHTTKFTDKVVRFRID